ncbi:MAG: hypothetical protein ACM3ME_04720 [Chloroflexota bacterium]
MNRLIFFLLYIICSFGELTAQTIFERVDTSSYVFKFIPYQRTANNKVLNQLALAHLKIPDKTKLIYSFRYRVSINYSQNDSLYIFLDVSTLNIKGDNKIRDYDIASLLKPAEFKISYTLENPIEGIIFERRLAVNLENDIAMIGSFPDSLWKEGTRINLNIDEIKFSEDDFRQLELELASIRDYYSSSSLIDTLFKEVQNSRKTTPELFDAARVYITGVRGLYLLDQSFDNVSPIVPGADPLKNKERKRILRYNFAEFNDYVVNKKSPLIIGNPYITLSYSYIESVLSANKLSQQVDYYSSPFFYKLFSNTVVASQFLEAKQIISQTAVNRIKKSPDFRIVSTEILRRYLYESNKLLLEKRYAEAIDLLTGARKFKNLNPYGTAKENIETKLAEARKGLIFSYTEIIQKSLDKNLVSLASSYLTEVENFINKYGITNEEFGPFREVYIRMADIHTQLGNNALVSNDFNKALTEFTTALELLNGYDSSVKYRAENGLNIAVRSLYNKELSAVYKLIAKGDHEAAYQQLMIARKFAEGFPDFYPEKSEIDTLMSSIASLKFNGIIDDIKDIVEANNEDIDKLVEARELAVKYNIYNTSVLDTLIYKKGMPWLNNLFAKGKVEYWDSQIDSALYYSNYAFNMAERLGLERLPEIILQHNKLTQLAGETFCDQAKGEFNSLMNQVLINFKDNKFNEGLSISDKARELVYLKATCGLTTAPINSILDEYKYALRWNSMVNEAFSLLREKKYLESSDLIQQAEALYSYYHLDSLKIGNVGYFDLAKKSNDKALIRHAIGYMLNKREPDKALILLDKLKQEGVLAIEAENLQEAVARNLGIRDINETPDLKVRVMLNSYTNNDRWYSKFESVYRYYTKSSTQPFVDKSLDAISDGFNDFINLVKTISFKKMLKSTKNKDLH